MRLSIQKWGNSAAFRLPAPLLEQIGATIGTAVEVSVTKEGLLLKPDRKPHYKLADLLAEMSSEGLPRVEGWENMPTVGKEAL